MEWISANWQWVLLAFYVLEKVVKESKAEWDDILVDGIKAMLFKLFKK